MKKKVIFKILVASIFLVSFSSWSQNCSVSFQQPSEFVYTESTQVITVSINPLFECAGNFVFDNKPDWIDIIQSGLQWHITCQENTTPESRSVNVAYSIESNGIFGILQINQNVGCYQHYYLDTDGDGFGNYNDMNPISSCTPVSGRVLNNIDLCINIPSNINNGCEADYENMNWIMSKAYNIRGDLKATSKSYFDALGKGLQTQTLDIETQRIWAAETLYDAQGRPAFQTSSAPINSYSGSFNYKSDFIKKEDGTTNYTEADFETDPENPTKIGSTANTLGHYYSTNNTDINSNEGNSYQDVTAYPFLRTIYSELNPGIVLKTIGGKQLDLNIETKSYSFSMPTSQELSQADAFNDVNYDNIKTIKTVVRDAHGIDAIVFTDTDGKTLAAARSGNEENTSTPRTMNITISEQGYVDIHIPVGCTGFDISNPSNNAITIYNLITELEETTAPSTLPNGFYRLSIADLANYQNDVVVTYKENYYDYSLNEYDNAGRLLASYQPLEKLKSEFTYNSLGQLVTSSNPDEGAAEFKYREDGQIRFSQNSKQAAVTPIQEFSYTNYDELSRPIESGVLISNNFASADPDEALPSGSKKEQNTTLYDALVQSDLDFLETLHADYHNPTFLASNVVKSSNINTTTYHSYDVYGRVKWIVQNINSLGAKTIDYKYDAITGNVLEVDYQKHESSERFIHKYTYNIVDQLTQIETSTDGTIFINQAKYSYYETGALKRTELADNLQGIDFIYNLAGQLKAINHPSGDINKDPGHDGTNGFNQDVFSMTLDYYTGDYNRTATPTTIASVTDGVNQYNGNIKAMTWKIKGSGTPDTQTYYYQYNKNNWLKSAGFGAPADGSGAAVDTITNSNIITSNGELLARQSITLAPGFHVTTGVEFIAKIDPNATGANNGDYNVSNLTYDKNGNILSLNRNKHTEEGSNEMDQLTYTYKPSLNQLDHVTDAVTGTTNADDIKSQGAGNYTYNQIGQLVKNEEEDIIYEYNTSGLVTNIKKISATWPNGYPAVSFYYNDRGHRIQKRNWLDETDTYYVRDVLGNALAIYYKDVNNSIETLEYPIYGASRIGVHYKETNRDVYQLTDHLGNVRAVIARSGSDAAISSSTDYYPFGMPMPGRQIVNGEPYRYAFQGQEKDSETGKEAFQLRLWDSRIGRWLSPDPARQYSSPYLGMGNSPLNGIDPDGALFGWLKARWRQLWHGGEVWENEHGDVIWGRDSELSYLHGNNTIGLYSSDIEMKSFGAPGFGGFGKALSSTGNKIFGTSGTIGISKEFELFNLKSRERLAINTFIGKKFGNEKIINSSIKIDQNGLKERIGTKVKISRVSINNGFNINKNGIIDGFYGGTSAFGVGFKGSTSLSKGVGYTFSYTNKHGIVGSIGYTFRPGYGIALGVVKVVAVAYGGPFAAPLFATP